MDIIGKILQAILGGERPRTWVDLAIVLAICVTYSLTQALRFLHHQRNRQAGRSPNAGQLADAVGTADPVHPPKSAEALVVLILACAGLQPAQLRDSAIDHVQGDALPLCFVRNTACPATHSQARASFALRKDP